MVNLIYILILAFASLASAQQVQCPKPIKCPDKSKVVAVNVGFQYYGMPGGTLTGHYDVKTYKEMTKKFAGSSLTIDDMNSAADNREKFLSTLKSFTRNAEVVHLNFSGHGYYTKNGEWSLLLPLPKGSKCRTILVKDAEVQAALEKRKLALQPYRGGYGTSFLKEDLHLRHVLEDDYEITSDTRQPEDVQKTLRDIPVMDDLGECGKHLVPISEIQKAIGNKNVFGIFDACFSGALTGIPNFSVLTPVDWDQFAVDMTSGGMMNQLRRTIRLHNCMHANEKLRLEDLYAKTIVARTPLNYGVIEPELGRKTNIPDTWIRTPKYTANCISDCFDYSFAGTDGIGWDYKCPFPQPVKLKTEESTFKPFAGRQKKFAQCSLSNEEKIDPMAIDSSVCPTLVQVKGMTSNCQGWVEWHSLSGKAEECAEWEKNTKPDAAQ